MECACPCPQDRLPRFAHVVEASRDLHLWIRPGSPNHAPAHRKPSTQTRVTCDHVIGAKRHGTKIPPSYVERSDLDFREKCMALASEVAEDGWKRRASRMLLSGSAAFWFAAAALG